MDEAHPVFIEEEEHLQETIQGLEQKRAELLVQTSGEYLWESPGSVLVKTNRAAERLQKCKRALQDLYFGRVDWKSDNSQAIESFYIGLTEFSNYIYAWQDTLAADLYYTRETDREEGVLQLVRNIQIDNQKLIGVEDQFTDPSITGELDPDSLLAKLLKESRGQLHEIVATINAQQYKIIRSPLDTALIVQGVPGSGKTVIALHRVSFLLYNHKELRNTNVVVLGPNPIFMQYVSSVLPSLGERKIPQRTFDQWVIDQLGENLSYQSQEELLEFLLSSGNPQAEKIMHLRNCQNMGSPRMATLLERYVEDMRQNILTGKRELICGYFPASGGPDRKTIEARKSLEDIRTILDEVKMMPFNKQRDAVILKLSNLVSVEIVNKMNVSFQMRDTALKQVFEQIESQVAAYLDDWRAQNVSLAFRRLFRQRELTHKYGAGLFSQWDLELMTIDAPTAQNPFRFSDLSGLLYLNILLNGTQEQTFGHIVVDEAQDIPALFFQGISHFLPKKSITILGDVGQGIFINNGLSSWKDLFKIFPNLNEQVEELNICYRSTWEIMQHANDILRRSGLPDEQLIRPLNRFGEKVEHHSFQNDQERTTQVIQSIQSYQERDWRSIAVIAKSAEHCRKLAADLQKNGFDDFELVDNRNKMYSGGVVILPAYLSKGLEFDAVVLADGENYESDALSARLLFVAVTRAAHKLDVCWVGELSPLLNPEFEQVQVLPFLRTDTDEIVSIAKYAENAGVDPDWCIELLARAGQLPLLNEGGVDPVVMDMVIQTARKTSRSSNEDILLVPLKAEEEEQIRNQVHGFESQKAESVQDALGFINLVFGLLRNHLRNLGLDTNEEKDLQVVEQVILLVRLKKLIEDANLVLPAGRGAGQKRLQEDLNPEWKSISMHVLQTLIDHGLLETQTSNQDRILYRISPEWIKPILDTCLGYPSSDLDLDLKEDLPCLPEAIDHPAFGGGL